jgi:hypothetical protein
MRAVVCIPPPISPDHPSLGVAMVTSVFLSYKIDVDILDLNAELASSQKFPMRYWQKEGYDSWSKAKFQEIVWSFLEKRLKQYLLKNDPVNIFGLHVSSASKELALRIAQMVRDNWPETTIIAGGPEFFNVPITKKEFDSFDMVFAGEAEMSIEKWLNSFNNGDDSHEFIQLSTKSANLNQLPFPVFQLFPLHSYKRPGVIPMEISRGCVNRCAFCEDSRMWKNYRRKSNLRVELELDAIKKVGAQQISFCDSVLNPSIKLFHDFLELVGKTNLSWDGMIQAKNVDLETAVMMRQSNCENIFIGIESFSRSFLRMLNKEHSAIFGKKALENLLSEEINVSIGLIVSGPPLQRRKEFEYDLDILKEMGPALSSVAINPLCIPNGTPLAQKGPRLGIKGLNSKLGWKFWHSGNGFDDVRLRLEWCLEVAELLTGSGGSLGENYQSFEVYIEEQIHDADLYFQGILQ